MRRLERKIRKLERGNEEKYEWKKEGIRHQATFNNKVQDWLTEKLRTSLGSGEEKLNERTHLLKIADKYGWDSAKELLVRT